MMTLPNECFFEIFNNFRDYDRKSLFSCLLVNRQWCKIIIPILWCYIPLIGDKRLIRLFLLMLNAKEQALLIPFNIILPNYPKPLFEYTSYFITLDLGGFYGLDDGIENWLYYNRFELSNELRSAINVH